MNEEIKRCRRCNRKLKDEESKQRGFGKLCYKKHLAALQNRRRLFTIKEDYNVKPNNN